MPFLPELSLRVQRRIAYVILAIGVVIGIWRDAPPPSPPLTAAHTLDLIEGRGYMVVLTRNAPTIFYFDRDENPAGYEYDLAEDFAATLGVETRYVVMETVGDILAAMTAGEGDIAAAGLTRTPEREQRYRFGPAYREIRQQLVCNRHGNYPRALEDLPGHSILVIANSSYEERLIELSREFDRLTWQSTLAEDTEGILAMVAAAEVDCTIADSNIVRVNRRYSPELIVPFAVSEPQRLAWVIPRGAESLSDALSDWYAEFSASASPDLIEERHYGHVDEFDFVDLRAFDNRIENRLPAYRQWFEEAAEEEGLPWTLLAAVGYQESHWDPNARSPTGVRGLMMLTLAAAQDLRIDNRLDPEASIRGGAEFLARLYDRIPEEVTGEDRLYFALAAYNVGFGHLRDAMRLAERQGRDPTLWSDLREVLPLLARRQYYSTLRYGYARGTQAVVYVQHIRDYWDILENRFPAHDENTGSAFDGVDDYDYD